MHVVAANYVDETTSLLGFVKSTSSIGCVGAENNAPVDSNTEEPTRPCIHAEEIVHSSSPALVNLQDPLCHCFFLRLLYPKSSSVQVIIYCSERPNQHVLSTVLAYSSLEHELTADSSCFSA